MTVLIFFLISLFVLPFLIYGLCKGRNGDEIDFKNIPDSINFINATNANSSCRNRLPWYIYGGLRSTLPQDVEKAQSKLKTDWGIVNKDKFKNTTHWLLYEGHTSSYRNLVMSNDFSDYDDIPKRRTDMINVCKEIDLNYRDKGLLAWDICRVVLLASLTYKAGYISFEESISYSINACTILQENFSSWDDMMGNYILGYKFWSLMIFDYKDASECNTFVSDIYRALKGSTIAFKNPYLVPWNTSLVEEEILKFKENTFVF